MNARAVTWSDEKGGACPTDELAPLLRSVEDALGPCAWQDHLALSVRLPTGALHFKSTGSVPAREWRPAEIEFVTSAGKVRVELALGETTDLAGLCSAITSFSAADATSTTTIAHGQLSLHSLRQVLVQVLTWFSPFSINVTASE